MPSRACAIFRCLCIGIDIQRIIFLRIYVVVVVIVVEDKDFRIQTGGPKRRSEDIDEIPFHIPVHQHRHRVPCVQRFVLRGNCINVEALSLHILDPFHEILRIIVIIIFAERASGPAIMRACAISIYLHPLRGGPWRADYLYVGIYRIDFLQDRYKVFFIIFRNSEIFDPRLVTPGVTLYGKIGATDTDADQAGSQPLSRRKYIL